jgi:aspartyl-tRNA(Asn)/glutamyl-tRNA(Gln) amidotransferase subunit A
MTGLTNGIPGYSELRPRYIQGGLLCSDHLGSCISLIREHQKLNAVIESYEVEAQQAAMDADRLFASGMQRPLEGMLLAVKDNIAVRGKALTCGSAILRSYTSPENATVVQRASDAGVNVLLRTNMDEFGMGSSSEHSIYGPVLNPIDPERVAGGSSGGSAVAVATGMADIALGSDTGGSVRQPAAFNGIFGFKPSYGRLSRKGLVAFSSSCDQIGILARSIQDIESLFEVMSGADPCDSTTAALESWLADSEPPDGKKLRIGIPESILNSELPASTTSTIEAAIRCLRESGVSVEHVSLPFSQYSVAANYVIANVEAASNLARFDGIRYGATLENESLAESYSNSRSAGFGKEAQRRIMLGMWLKKDDRQPGLYERAMSVRRLIRDEYAKIFESYDGILTPTASGAAFALGEKSRDPLRMYLSDSFTCPANMAGVPAISIPAGTDDDGFPLGLQVMTKQFDETMMFRIAKLLSQRLKDFAQ